MSALHHQNDSDEQSQHSNDDENLHPFKWPERMIGRDKEWAIIRGALEAQPFKRQILYFQGKGGIGKTRLLKEAAGLTETIDNVLATKVIDLYHFRYHLPMMMMTTIAQQLQDSLRSKGDARPVFTTFRRQIKQYLLRSGGVEINKVAGNGGSVAIEVEVRKQLTEAFIKDYKKLAAEFVIVLLIDTFEKLDPIIEETKEFNFRASHFEDWIVTDFIPRLPKTLTLVAGRENERQKQILNNPKVRIEVKPTKINELTRDETREFAEESLDRSPEDHVIEQLYAYSRGRPVLLSLGLAYLQIENLELPLIARSWVASEQDVDEQFLITSIINSLQLKKQNIANLLIKAYLLRKGLNRDLLVQIDQEDDIVGVERRINHFAQLPFFKRTGPRQDEVSVVVLHDEMYDRFYGRLPDTDAPLIYDQAIDYIQGLIDKKLKHLEQGIGDEQNWLLQVTQGEGSEEIERKSTRLQMAQEIRLMRVEQLFYELARHPKRGYQHYRRLSHAAIQAHDEDFDTLLRGEFARFFELNPDQERGWGQAYREQLDIQGVSWKQVIFEEGVRWVERRLNAYVPGEDRYTQALDIASRVEERYSDVYKQNALARYSLDAARLRAKMYLSPEALAGQNIGTAFQELAEQLEASIQQLEDQRAFMDHDDLDVQEAEISYTRLILAALYNDFGYYERMYERYKSATDKYTKAIRLYRQLGAEANGLLAVALTNLAFARHQQGFSKAGLTLVKAALDLAMKYGSPQQIATTLNTQARLQLRVTGISVNEAYATVSKARTIFHTLKSGRGSALCALTEGNVLCARAANRALQSSGQRMRNFSLAQKDYQQALACYQDAMDKFDEQPEDSQQPQSDLLRRIEARVGMGAVYRERGLIQRQENVVFEGIDANDDLQQALTLAQQALDLCNDEVPKVTQIAILEDMAFVYIEQEEFDRAREKLQQARKLIPEGYRIDPQVGIHYDPTMQNDWIYWFRLSQLELQEALIAFRNGVADVGCKQLLRSFACLHTFSPYAPLRHSIRKLGKREILCIVRQTDDPRSRREQIEVLRHATQEEAYRLSIPQTIMIELEELFDELEGLVSL